MVSQTISHYTILKKLGAGGMGEVYLAEDTKLDRTVALKILPAEIASDSDRMRRFIREAKTASALKHPNVAHIYEIGEADGTNFIAMEYVEGQTLDAKIAGRPLESAEVVDIAVQISDALDEAHNKNITHRDIKPSNIMITPRGQVKVLDFGLAKVTRPEAEIVASRLSTEPETELGVVMGTVCYMSPEQALGKQLDHRSDIFSLGVVLYEMATGRRPFSGTSASETIDQITHAQPEAIARFNYNVPSELDRIIRKCLEKDRDRRYQSARELLVDLRNLKRDSDSAVVLAAQPARAAPRFPWKALVLSIAIAALIAVPIYIFRGRRGSAVGSPAIESLAVLPLKNIGGDVQDEYLSDGISDELITKLTKLKTVRVISRSVALRFKNSQKDAAQIGSELGVDAVLEGTMRKMGNRFRLNVHLVSAKDGFEIWADDSFEHELRDLLDAERQLAEAVATKLKGQLTPQQHALVAKPITANVDAYEYFLRGKEHYAKSGASSQPVGVAREEELARQMFERAIQLDPSFADAYAWLALDLYYLFHDGQGDRATLDAAVANANKALQVDPNLIEARRALVHIYHSTGQTEEGLRQGKQALDTNPNDFDAVEAAALAYFRAGMMDKAIPLFQKAVSMDPSNASMRSELARCYYHTHEYQKGIDVLEPLLAQERGGEWIAMHLYMGLGQFDKAIEMGRRLTEISPTDGNVWLNLGHAFQAAGQIARAREAWREGARRGEGQVAAFENVRVRIWLGLIYAELGEREKALDQARRAVAAEPKDPWVLFWTSAIHGRLGHRLEALDYLKRALANGFLSIHYLEEQLEPAGTLYAFRNDPEFQAARAGLERKIESLRKQY